MARSGSRSATDADHGGVQAVLGGDRSGVRVLQLEPDDLRIFRKLFAMHRVTPLEGALPRFVAIFSYVAQPGMVGSPERTRQLYGRALPVHIERAGLRADALVD